MGMSTRSTAVEQFLAACRKLPQRPAVFILNWHCQRKFLGKCTLHEANTLKAVKDAVEQFLDASLYAGESQIEVSGVTDLCATLEVEFDEFTVARDETRYLVVWRSNSNSPLPVYSNRSASRWLNEEGMAALLNAGNDIARERWSEAITADPTFSLPFYNLAKSLLSEDKFKSHAELDAIQRHIETAQKNAQSGELADERAVSGKLPPLRDAIEKRRSVATALSSRAASPPSAPIMGKPAAPAAPPPTPEPPGLAPPFVPRPSEWKPPSKSAALPPGLPTAPAGHDRSQARQLNEAGLAAIKAGDMELAKQKWREAAKTDPTYASPMYNLAKFEANAGIRNAEHLFAIEDLMQTAMRNVRDKERGSEDMRVFDKLMELEEQLQAARIRLMRRWGS